MVALQAGKARLRPELVERLRRGKGEIVEYAVKMRQLPAEKMLSSLLRRDRITRSIIKKVAQKIADFHQKAETNKKIADYGSLKIIKKNCRENFEQTKKYIGITTSAKDFQEIKSWTEDFIIKNKELFEKRMKNGKIRDCHGDLQSDHICLQGRKIHIYDCIEFNERFRYGDVASEVAFLAMDFDFHGRPDLSDYLAESYARETADKDFLKLLKFYKCYRAYVLGKVRSFKLDDFHVPQKEKEKAKNLAKRYFKLAYSYICRKPTLIVICGLSGSGKTTTAVILAKKTGFQYISSDIVRKKLAKIPPFEHKYHEFGKGIYSPEFFQKTYEKMFGRAEGFLKNGKSVIIDATFKKREERKKVKNLAEKLGVKFLLIECRLSEKIIRKKMKERAKRKIVSDADWKIYQKQKKDFDKITEIPRQNHIIVDTSKPMKKITPVILKRIL